MHKEVESHMFGFDSLSAKITVESKPLRWAIFRAVIHYC